MKAYIFECEKCKHEECFKFGAGLLDSDVLDEELKADDKAAEELKEDVLSGKYGDYIAKVCAVDPEQLFFDAKEDFYWCWKCKTPIRSRHRSIDALSYKKPYSMHIHLEHKCEDCGESLLGISIDEPPVLKCPKCGEIEFKFKSFVRD